MTKPPLRAAVVEIAEPGGPGVLRLAERELAPPGPGEVLIAVRAAGVNRPDLLQRMGLYPAPPGASDVPGLEVAGTVQAVGEVVALAPGARVMALLAGGGYASRAVCDARHVLPVPDGVRFEEAAAFPETAYTVWANAFEAGRLLEGETLFVHGATSGIGTMAGMLARARGATAWGTVGTQEKAALARARGYGRVWLRDDPWAEEAREAADVVLDMAGGDFLARNLGLLREGGRHVSIAFLRGAKGEVDVTAIMRRRLTLTGSTLRARPAEEKARLTEAVREHVLPHLASGAAAPIVDAAFPLARAADAHRAMEAGEVAGKAVLLL
jgi:putative PIG3 family NAD(P)H quinone oxidoreductase